MANPREFASEIIVARRLFFEGVDAVASHDDLRVRTGLLLADLAAESLLKSVLRFYERDVPEAVRFAELLGSVKSAPRPDGPSLDYLRARLEPLRSMRNAVMHEGLAQVPEEAQKRVARARDGVTRLVRDVFGFDFVNLRFSEFVRHPVLRTLLADAEKSADAQDYTEAIVGSVAVHNRLLDMWGSFLRDLFSIERGYRHTDDERRDRLIFSVSGGVFLPDLKRFREISNGAGVSFSVSGKRYATLGAGWRVPAEPDLRAKNVRFALDFVGGMVLQIEPRLGADPSE